MRCDNSEAAVLREVLRTLRYHGWLAWRANAGMLRVGDHTVMLAPAGTSDVIALIPSNGLVRGGRMMVVECKRRDGKGRLTEPQSEFLKRVRDNGGVALLVDDLRTLDRAILALTIDPDAKLDLQGRPL